MGVDSSSVPAIIARLGLKKIGGRYSWHRIWRAVHAIEGFALAQHLADLKTQHSNSKFLTEIEDLEDELRKPLLTFSQMAGRLGHKPDTLTKALRQRRFALPLRSFAIMRPWF